MSATALVAFLCGVGVQFSADTRRAYRGRVAMVTAVAASAILIVATMHFRMLLGTIGGCATPDVVPGPVWAYVWFVATAGTSAAAAVLVLRPSVRNGGGQRISR